MAYAIIGNDCIDRVTYFELGWTDMDLNISAPIRGIIKLWSVYMVAAGNAKIKIFRDDGTNYIFIGESASIPVSIGLNTDLPCYIPVEKGDLIAIYHDQRVDVTIAGANNWTKKAGDISTTSLKTTWTLGNAISSIQGKIFTRVSPIIL